MREADADTRAVIEFGKDAWAHAGKPRFSAALLLLDHGSTLPQRRCVIKV
jgi:hypothetical protein